MLELGGRYARAMVTALARLDGSPVGVLANNPLFSAGAITADAAEKATRFLSLCNAYGLPVLSLCDTPGFMVGTDAERTGLVRRAGALFNTASALRVPLVTVVLRKGYGLGAMAMAGGSFHSGRAIVAWPTGEFGGMNLEGAVRLGMRRELAAIDDAEEREQAYQSAVDAAYEHGKALNTATHLEVDDVIDPAADAGAGDPRAAVRALPDHAGNCRTSSSTSGNCAAAIFSRAAARSNHAPRSTSGISMVRPLRGGQEISQVLLTSCAGSTSCCTAHAWTCFPLRSRTGDSSSNVASGGTAKPVSSVNSRRAAASSSSSPSSSPLGIPQLPRSLRAKNGPPGCTRNTSRCASSPAYR